MLHSGPPGRAPGELGADHPLRDDRIISVTSFEGYGTLEKVPFPAVPGLPLVSHFDEIVSFVGAGDSSQDTTIGATELSGWGDTFTDGAGATSGFSIFDITFQVDEPVVYDLSGYVYGWSYLEGDVLPSVTLSGPGGVVYEPPFPGSGGLHYFADTGSLVPGADYRLVLEAVHYGGCLDGGCGEGHEWSFDFVIAVPEPSTTVTLLLGLLFMTAMRRRRPSR